MRGVITLKMITYMNKINKQHMTLIQSIERTYGTMEDCPADDPLLIELHQLIQVYDPIEYEEYIAKFDRNKIDELRNERGISKAQLGRDLGFSRQWYNGFIKNGTLNKGHIDTFVAYFEVEESTFMK